MALTFHSEACSFQLRQKKEHRKWLLSWISDNKFECGEISLIFTSNQHLLSINREYLEHDYFTDIITFDYTEASVLSGDVFISIDEVKLNSQRYEVSFDKELRRVMVHGLNHLMGYKDHSEQEKKEMRHKENEALLLWNKA